MADNSTLKSSIRNVVKTNGDGAITGQNMQDVLISMVDVLGEGYQFLGGCTPSTNPGTPDNNVCYLATEAGTYSNFTGDAITEPTIFYYDDSWHALSTNGSFAAVLRVTDIVNNLNSTSTTKVLGAAQGKILGDILNNIAGAITEGYAFMGLAATNAAAPTVANDYNVAYLATSAGTYTNLGNLTVAENEIALLERYVAPGDIVTWRKVTCGSYVKVADIVNNTESSATDKPLSANMGKSLQLAVNAKYTKPGTGIPKTDLASGVQTSLGKADSAYQKPEGGIPSTDMTEAVQTSLGKADTAVQPSVLEETLEDYAQKDGYYASMAVGLADNLRGNVYADEQFSLRMTGGDANEVGGIGVVQQLKGAGAAISQLFPEGAGHDFSGDVSLDGTGGNAEAVVRYSNGAGTVEMGYLLCLEAFVSQTLTQEQLDAIAAKDTGKQDRDKAVWLTPAGAVTSAPTIESGQTEVTFSGWRIAMRVKASEVRDSSASTYWFTTGTAGRQVYDVAVAEGIDATSSSGPYYLANGWNTGSAMEYLNHMAAQGLPTHSVKAMSALLAVTKIGIKTVKSRNLLNPQTGRALLKAYVNDADGFVDNEYTMLDGLPSGSTMAFTSLLTGKTETLTMLDATHFVIPSDGWLQITGTLPESIIATWDGTKDNTAADEYATESHTWDVTQLFGTKEGGTEGHYYRFAPQGMRGAGSAQDVVELVGARGEVKVGVQDLGQLSWSGTGLIQTQFSSAFNDRMKVHGYAVMDAGWAVIAKNNLTIHKVTDSMRLKNGSKPAPTAQDNWLSGVMMWYELAQSAYITFTSLFLSASSTSDELTQMPADAIPLSEIQFADNNWSIEEAIYDAPEADANGVITPTAVTGQMRIQHSLDAAEQILTLQTEYEALEARVTALENR